VLLAADYPFLDVFWTMLVFFVWIAWFFILIRVFADVFRRHDISGFAKVLWLIFVIVLPFLGVFIYLVANSKGMTERDIKRPVGRHDRLGNGDREGEAAAGQRRDLAERVRRDQSEGPCLVGGSSGSTRTKTEMSAVDPMPLHLRLAYRTAGARS
jgi:hypothetical protein